MEIPDSMPIRWLHPYLCGSCLAAGCWLLADRRAGRARRLMRDAASGLTAMMVRRALVVLVSYLASAAAHQPGAPTAQTSFGALRGTLVPTNATSATVRAEAFLGVPYALPPVGQRRWASPVDWQTPYPRGVWDSTRYGSVCPQLRWNGSAEAPTGHEDCLFLNIFRPERVVTPGGGAAAATGALPTALLPTLLFIHGGAFVGGAASDFNCAGLAANNHAVVITINYRLGALGWISVARDAAADDDDESDEGHPSLLANWGLEDQRSAMRWARRELASLGGDPDRVMIFGESAGAMSVMLHMVSPPSAGLFRRVMSESGSPMDTWPAAWALNRSAHFARLLGCAAAQSAPLAERLACLRQPSLAQVMAAQVTEAASLDSFANVGWAPVVDGTGRNLPLDPLLLFKRGAINRGIDGFGAGTNTDEGSMFTLPYYPQGMSPAQYTSFVHSAATVGGRRPLNRSMLAAVRALYPCQPPTRDCSQVAVALVTDNAFVCGTRWSVRALASSGVKAFLYHWDFRAPQDHGRQGSYPDSYKVYHTIELPFVFGSPPSAGAGKRPRWNFTAHERALSARVEQFWVNHAAMGSPNGGERGMDAVWPEYSDADTNLIVTMNGTLATETGRRKQFCDFWASARNV
eukprot:COSAG01_NODE_911_length_12783_cov_145.960817_13_plen_634_part_00